MGSNDHRELSALQSAGFLTSAVVLIFVVMVYIDPPRDGKGFPVILAAMGIVMMFLTFWGLAALVSWSKHFRQKQLDELATDESKRERQIKRLEKLLDGAKFEAMIFAVIVTIVAIVPLGTILTLFVFGEARFGPPAAVVVGTAFWQWLIPKLTGHYAEQLRQLKRINRGQSPIYKAENR